MCDWEVQRFWIFKGNRKGEHFQEKDMEAKIIVWWNEPFYSFSNFYWRKVGFGIIILGQLREEEGNGSDDFSLVFSFMVIYLCSVWGHGNQVILCLVILRSFI